MEFAEYYKRKEKINQLKNELEHKSLDQLQTIIEESNDNKKLSKKEEYLSFTILSDLVMNR